MTQPSTLGEYLTSVRRDRRISIERAAEETRIRADFLMRMESDEFDFLAPAYMRGFLRTYARFLGVDPQPLIEEFDRRFGAPARSEPTQIVAMERRSRQIPRQRRKPKRGALAALVGVAALLLLTLVGLVSGPEEEPSEPAAAQPTASPTASAPPTPSPSISPTPEESALVLSDGMKVSIVASRGPCWVNVTADGVEVFTSPPSGLATGERAGPFLADDSMEIVLGNAGAVDLVVNGQTIGPVGDEGEVRKLLLPDDLDSFI